MLKFLPTVTPQSNQKTSHFRFDVGDIRVPDIYCFPLFKGFDRKLYFLFFFYEKQRHCHCVGILPGIPGNTQILFGTHRVWSLDVPLRVDAHSSDHCIRPGYNASLDVREGLQSGI